MAVSQQEFDQLKREISNLRAEIASLRDQISKGGSLEAKVKELEKSLKNRYPSPVIQTQEDVAFYEAIFDILVRKKIATQEEITHYLDLYKQIWTAIAHILIDKGITTAKEINCEVLAFHHFLRSEGLNTGKPANVLFEERQKYVDELMAMPDPLEMLGR